MHQVEIMRRNLILIVSMLFPGSDAFAQEMSGFIANIDEKFDLDLVTEGDLSRDPMRINAAALFTILAHTQEIHIHQMRGAAHNQVFIQNDGHREAVFEFDIDENNTPIDGTGKLVTDCVNKGSYNYFHPSEYPLSHFSADILPWMIMGNCREDPTSRIERIEAYVKDFEQGIDLVLSRNSDYVLPRGIGGDGGFEAISFFIKALQTGGFDPEKLVPENVQNDEIQTQIIEALEKGLKDLLADA